MTSTSRKWGIYLCRCSVPETFDEHLLDGLGAVVAGGTGADGYAGFAAALRAAFGEAVVLACTCTDPGELAAACEAAGLAPAIHPVALRTAPEFATDPGAAADKTRRLIAGTLRGLERRPDASENLLAVGGRVVLFTDGPEGLGLAGRLQGQGSLRVFLEGDPAAFGSARGGVNWGAPESVSGRLGELTVRVLPVDGSDFSGPQELQADQVVVVGARAEAIRHRTGVHRIPRPTPEALEQVVGAVAELTGTFGKPEHLSYDAGICAGGAADQEACGLCIPACPYDAVRRDPGNKLRIQVDHLACEGCGACTSACPTSALRFAEPAPNELYARLAELLAPQEGAEAGTPRAVVFHCEQQGRQALDWIDAQREAGLAALLPVEVPCLRYVSDAAMLAAVRLGAAGVGLLGCETCPNGERELLLGKLELAQSVLDAFGLGAERVRLLTAREDARPDALQALRTFAGQLAPAPLPADGKGLRASGNREVLGEVLGAFIQRTGKSVGGLKLAPGQPFGLATVRDEGCTLCRSCVTVCPTHAFAFDMDAQKLSFKHIACIHCGLCETVCPERVIALRRELYAEPDGLRYVTVAEDEMVRCGRCDKPFINRRALETVQQRLRATDMLGSRLDLLNLCPDCRGAAAMLDVREGWQP